MSLKGMVLSVLTIFLLSSCFSEKQPDTPAPTPSTPESKITLDGNLLVSLESNGLATFNLAGNVSFTDDVDPMYTWYFDGNNLDPITTSIASSSYQYSENDNYQVSVIISDKNNNAQSITEELNVTITNVVSQIENQEITAPTTIPITVNETTTATFNLDFFVSLTDEVSPEYTWYFGDGNSIITNTGNITHNYSSNGTYNALVVISDLNNLAQTVSIELIVTVNVIEDVTPSINIPSELIPPTETNGLVTFNLDNITTTGTVDLNFTWYFDDGSTQTSDSTFATHQYNQNGIYNVTIIVSDNLNTASSEQINFQVMITSIISFPIEAPIADFTTTLSNANQLTYEFDASSSTNSNNNQLTYAWSISDGAIYTDEIINHTFSEPGIFIVTLTVFNGDKEDSTSLTVNLLEFIGGDAIQGELLYNAKCAQCHEGDENDIYGEGSDTIEPININKFLNSSANLFIQIAEFMPHENAQSCVAQCAADIEAYMLTWPYRSIDISCNIENDAPKFGSRQLKVLTISEYKNSINDILGIEIDDTQLMADSHINNFKNQSKTAIDLGRFMGYQTSAVSISKMLYNDNFSTLTGLENCVALNDCADKFISETLTRLFRRELTQGEIETYTALFDVQFVTRDNQKEGLKLALRTALMSPNFLYRHELGMTKEQYITYNEELPAPAPWEYDSYEGNDFKLNYIMGDTLISGLLPAYQAAFLEHYFSGDDLIKIDLLTNTTGQEASISIDDVVIWEGVTTEMTTIELNYIGEASNKEIKVQAGNTELEIGRLEIGPPVRIPTQLIVPDVADDVYVLTPSEIASYIAYSFTGSTPDDILLSAAINNELITQDQIKIQIERLLQSDAAKIHFGNFAAQWFTTDTVLYSQLDSILFPTYTDEVKQSMSQEVREIFNDVMFDDSVPFSNLYDSNYTFLNQTLADFYGIDTVIGDDFEKTTATQRGGILASGAFLSAWSDTTESSLVLRAVKIRERLMCQQFAPFPSNVDLDEIYEQQDALVRSIIEQEGGIIRQPHLEFYNTNVSACQSCHEYSIDPLGLGLEDYDAAGLPRTQYNNGLSVDFTGYDSSQDTHQSALYGINDIYNSNERIAFQGVKELGEIFATGGASEVTKSCFIEMGFRFMTDKGTKVFDHANPSIPLEYFEKVSNVCTAEEMKLALDENENPRDAFIELGISDMVRFRKEFNQ